MKNKKLSALFEISIIILTFIFISYIVQTNLEFFENLIGGNLFLGILIYIFIVIIAIVIPPITSIPLLPLLSNLWGWQLTALVSTIGWMSGSTIVFVMCRTYGINIIKKFISLKEIHKIEKKISREKLFLSVVFLRMVIPVDILSYALGLFSKIKFWPYTIATFIGILPFTILLAYVGGVPFTYQVLAVLIAGIVITLGAIIKCYNERCIN